MRTFLKYRKEGRYELFDEETERSYIIVKSKRVLKLKHIIKYDMGKYKGDKYADILKTDIIHYWSGVLTAEEDDLVKKAESNARRVYATKLAGYFENDDKKFDRLRFLKASGVQDVHALL